MRWTTALLLTLCLAAAGRADEVTLKGGMTLEGTIVKETETKVVLKLASGGKTTLQKKAIESIRRGGTVQPKGGAKPDPAPTLPALGPGKTLEGGITFHEARLAKGTRVWIYRPAQVARPPLVLVAPAGSRMIHGMGLAAGDQPEHLPYARAGFCVVAYSVAGPVDQDATDAQFIGAIKTFLAAGGGMEDAKRALDYALAKVPVDARRVYTAGHSSAAVLALQFAAVEPRIKGCVAFAPCTNMVRHLQGEWLDAIEKAGAKGVNAFVASASPHALTNRIKAPTFLFHAKDDQVVKWSETQEFVRSLKKTNASVTFVPVESGGHYQPMIDEGIPAAIRWLKALP